MRHFMQEVQHSVSWMLVSSVLFVCGPTMNETQAWETRFGLLVQNISDIITVLAIDGTIQYESPSTVRILGFKPEELVGRNAFEFIHPDDIPAVSAIFQLAVANPGLTVSPEFRFRHADGSWVYLEAIGNNLLGTPEVNGLVVTSRDVTARRALEEQLRQAQKMEAIGQLAGGIAHDFNNMLMVMRGNCEVILSETSVASLCRRNAEMLLNTADRAAMLTQHLLTFSRQRIYNPQVLRFDALANESADMYRQLLGTGIELVVMSPPEPIWVRADPTVLEQVILNLVVNSRDAMPAGGKLVLETSNVVVDEASAHREKRIAQGRYAKLAVTDTGVGMDAHTQEHMFEPFFSMKKKGTGLGLSIVYSIVKQNGGHLLVSSELGKGTKFEIYLPAAEEAPRVSDPTQKQEAPERGIGTILLAEDEDGIREVVQEFLRGKGYTVIAAKDGLEALQLAEQHDYQIDALLTDVSMPRMTGLELSCRLAMQSPETKIIFMTGHAEDSEILYPSLTDDRALLQKPFELRALARVLDDALTPASPEVSDGLLSI
jgi:two-component system, cell cycle sensor histidine kinase and response regulator CckA